MRSGPSCPDMADVVGSLDNRESCPKCLFCFYSSATIVSKRCLLLQIFKMCQFNNAE